MNDNLLEAKINSLPPITDWQKVFMVLQQANESFLRGATLKELGEQLVGDIEIQGADFYDLPVATSSTPVSLPIPTTSKKFGFLANGKYSQPTGGTLEYTATQWGMTLFDGTKWIKKFTLDMPQSPKADKVEKNNTNPVESNAVYNTSLELAKGDLKVKFPYDKSAILFDGGAMSLNYLYWNSNIVFSRDEKVKRAFVLPSIAGQIALCLVHVNGSNVEVISRVNVSAASGNVNIFENIPFVYPDESKPKDYQFFLGVAQVQANVLKYKNQTTGNAFVAPISGGAISTSNGNFEFPIWCEKMYLIDELQSIKDTGFNTANMVGQKVTSPVPYNKSSVSATSNASSDFWFGDPDTYFGSGKRFVSAKFNMHWAGWVKIRFAIINGNTFNVLYDSPVFEITNALVDAENNVTITREMLTDLPVGVDNNPRVQVFFSNEPGSSNTPIGYKSDATKTVGYYNINKATGVLTRVAASATSVVLCYHIEVEKVAYNPLVSEVLDLKSKIGTTTKFNDFLDAVTNQNYIRLHGNIILEQTVNIPENRVIIGDGSAKLVLSAGVNKGLYLNGSYNTVLEGFKISGECPQLDISGTSIISDRLDINSNIGRGTKQGIHVIQGDGVIIRGVHLENFDAEGFLLEQTGANGVLPLRFIKGLTMSDCFGRNCYKAFETSNTGEYSRFSNIKAIHSIVGFSVRSGNITISNGQFEQNRIGAHVGSGSNNAHGSFVGGTFNHNYLRGILITNITNGHVFDGCNFFDGAIEIYDATGVIISGSLIASEIIATLNGDLSNPESNNNQAAFICGNFFRSDGGYNSGKFTKSGNGKLLRVNNEFTTGKNSSGLNGTI